MCYEDNIFQGNSQEDAHKLALTDLFALIRFPSLASLPLPLPSFSRFLFFFPAPPQLPSPEILERRATLGWGRLSGPAEGYLAPQRKEKWVGRFPQSPGGMDLRIKSWGEVRRHLGSQAHWERSHLARLPYPSKSVRRKVLVSWPPKFTWLSLFPWSLTRTPLKISSCLSPPLRQICKLPHLCGNGREQERRKKEKNPPTCQQTGKKITQALSHSAVGLPFPPTVAAAPASWTETWICSAPFPVPSWLLSISPASNRTPATSRRVLDSRLRVLERSNTEPPSAWGRLWTPRS